MRLPERKIAVTLTIGVMGSGVIAYVLWNEMMFDFYTAREQGITIADKLLAQEVAGGKLSAAEAKFGYALGRAEMNEMAALKRTYRERVWWKPFFFTPDPPGLSDQVERDLLGPK